MIAIIGASVSGNNTAYLLAKAGYEVRVFEEHKEIGKPFACTGIVTHHINDAFPLPKRLILNEVYQHRIFSPDGSSVDFSLKRPDCILDRVGLDRHLKELAEKQGARFELGCRFAGLNERPLSVRIEKKGSAREFACQAVIGADGPLSPVAKAAGLFGKRSFITGVQATAKLRNENIIETYLFKGGFAWVVPISSSEVRIGLVSHEVPGSRLKSFLESRIGKSYEECIIERQAGLEPLYNPLVRSQKDHIYLVGDAATQVKAATFGGIIQSLLASKVLANCIASGKNYDSAWKRQFGRDLLLSLMIRRILDSFSDKDCNKLVATFNDKGLQKVISSSSRDFPSRFALRLLMKKPSLLAYARFLPAALGI